DVRVVGDRHPAERDHARKQQCHEQHDRRHRVADAPRRNVPEIHVLTTLLRRQRAASRLGFTFWPGLRNGPADSTTASFPLRPLAIVTPWSLTVPIWML